VIQLGGDHRVVTSFAEVTDVGDLGTHAYHLLRYITGLDAEQVSARMDVLVPGRRVFDNVTITARLSDDVPATIWASMAATGNNHGRFDRDYAELKRAVDAGEIGDVELIQLTSRCPTMPPLEYVAVSGGQMRDQGVHFSEHRLRLRRTN
jgi:predicted dehydrogenase